MDIEFIARRVLKVQNISSISEGTGLANGVELIEGSTWSTTSQCFKNLSKEDASQKVDEQNAAAYIKPEFGKRWKKWEKSKERNKIETTKATGNPRQEKVSTSDVSNYITIADQKAKHDQARNADNQANQPNKTENQWLSSFFKKR